MNLETQKNKLEEEKVRLLKQLDLYAKDDPYMIADRDTANTVDDDITEIEGHDRITATRIALKEDLRDVEDALKRIESGSYGVCLNCGEKIEEERLTYMPAAKYCLSCQNKRQ